MGRLIEKGITGAVHTCTYFYACNIYIGFVVPVKK